MDRIKRITEMERRLNAVTDASEELRKALGSYWQVQNDLTALNSYFGSEQWLSDVEADEAGELPADLHRGVLTEDAIWDELEANRELAFSLLKTGTRVLEEL